MIKVYVLELEEYYESWVHSVCSSWEAVVKEVKEFADAGEFKIVEKHNDETFRLERKDGHHAYITTHKMSVK